MKRFRVPPPKSEPSRRASLLLPVLLLIPISACVGRAKGPAADPVPEPAATPAPAQTTDPAPEPGSGDPADNDMIGRNSTAPDHAFGEPPTPFPRTPEPGRVHTRDQLLEAIRDTPEGRTVYLGAAIIEGPIVLDRRVSLSGLGVGESNLVNTKGPALIIRAPGSVRVSSLGIYGNGPAAGPLVQVEAGVPRFEDVGFVSAARPGLRAASPDVFVELSDCSIQSRGGLELSAGAKARLTRVRLIDAPLRLSDPGTRADILDSEIMGTSRDCLSAPAGSIHLENTHLSGCD